MNRNNIADKFLLIISIIFIALYLWIALSRIDYPIELEWMEGAIVDHIQRVIDDKPLYSEPSPEFTAFIYAPAYYYLSACAAKIVEPILLTARLISILASGLLFLTLFMFVYRESGSFKSAIISVGFFSATYGISGFWFDLARVDSLFMALLVLSLYLLRFSEHIVPLMLSGLLMALSFFTKQSILVIAFLMSLFSLLKLPGWKRIIFPAVFTTVSGLGVLFFNYLSAGWFSYYTFTLPGQHNLYLRQFFVFWIKDMGIVAIAFIFAGFYLSSLVRSKLNKISMFYLNLLFAMVVVALFSRMHGGGYLNVLMPAYAALSIFLGLGYNYITGKKEDINAKIPFLSSGGQRFGAKYFWQLLLTIQFIILIYNPLPQIPSPAQEETANTFINKLKLIEGDIYLPSHGYVPSLANNRSYAHMMAISDVLRGTDQNIAKKLRRQTVAFIKSRQFKAIVIDADWLDLEPLIEDDYEQAGYMFDDPDFCWTVTGFRASPKKIYFLRSSH